MIQTPFRSLFTRYLPLFFLALVLLVSASGCNARWHLDGDNRAAHSAERVRTLQEQAEEGDANAQALLGFLYYRGSGVSQDYDQARKWFEKAAEWMPDHGRLFYNLAIAHQTLENPAEAEQAYQRAIEIDPQNGDFRYGLITLYMQQAQYKKALEQAETLDQIFPGNPQIQQLLQAIRQRM